MNIVSWGRYTYYKMEYTNIKYGERMLELSAQLYSEYTKAAIQTNLFENISTSWSVTRK